MGRTPASVRSAWVGRGGEREKEGEALPRWGLTCGGVRDRERET